MNTGLPQRLKRTFCTEDKLTPCTGIPDVLLPAAKPPLPRFARCSTSCGKLPGTRGPTTTTKRACERMGEEMNEMENLLRQEQQRMLQLTQQFTVQMRESRASASGARTVVIRIHKAADEAVSRAKAQVACKQGCAMCCHYHVMISATEALALAERLEQLPPEQFARVRARLNQNSLLAASMTPADHIKINVACALLEGNQCIVYQDRPLVCRRHHSMEVDACERAFNNPADEGQQLMNAPLAMGIEAVIHAHDRSAKQAGFDATKYEMNAALKAALSSPATARRRWRDGKLTFPDVGDRHLV